MSKASGSLSLVSRMVSLEVVDLQTGKWLKSIPGFKKTQGIATSSHLRE